MNNPLVTQMLTLIDKQFADGLTLHYMASSLNRQPAYLGRLFRQELGSTVREYLTRVRLQHAVVLIRDGVKIEAVALSVGYRSKKNFYQQFKRRFGTTPIPYRTGAYGAAAPNPLPGPVDATQPEDSDLDRRAARASKRSTGSDLALRELPSIIRQSNRAWRMAVQMQRALLQNFTQLRIPMFLTNAEGRYVGANGAASEVSGYTVDEIRGLSPTDLFEHWPGADIRWAWQLLLQRSGRPSNAVIRRKDGQATSFYMVSLRNVLLDWPDMSSLLERRPVVPE